MNRIEKIAEASVGSRSEIEKSPTHNHQKPITKKKKRNESDVMNRKEKKKSTNYFSEIIPITNEKGKNNNEITSHPIGQ